MERIPEEELHVTYARSSGPGGQNVNKRETKAVLHWRVGSSTAFSEQEKARIRKVLANRCNAEDEIVVWADGSRSQEQNRTIVISRLQAMVEGAAVPPKPRKASGVPRVQKRRRLEDKRRHSRKKQVRKSPGAEE